MEYGILDITGAKLICKFVAPTKILNNAPSFFADSVSLKRHTVSQKAQRWEIMTNVMPENNSREFFVHNTITGHNSMFLVRMPQPYGLAEEIENINTTITVTGGSKGQRLVSHTALTSKIPAGSFIKFSGHNKIYVLANDMKSGLVEIFPALMADVNGNEIIYKHKDVKLLASYDVEVALGITYTDGILSDPGQIRLVERI